MITPTNTIITDDPAPNPTQEQIDWFLKRIKTQKMEVKEMPKNWTPPPFMNSPIGVSEWVKYKGEVYFAELNYQESLKRNKPIFDLAYCATKASNGLFLKQRCYNKNMTVHIFDHLKSQNS